MKKRATETRPQFTYSGNLAIHPLPELLFTIGQYKVPGVITFTNRSITKQVFIRAGNVIFAASNAPEDHLGEFLFRCGKVSRVDYDNSIELLAKSKGKWQGEILIELNAIRRDELPWAVRSHQQAIVWSLFNWFEGNVQFNIGKFRHSKPIMLDIPIPRVILDGVRHINQAKKIMHYMGNRSTILEQEDNALLVIELFGADEKEREVLRRVDGKTNLYDLCANAPYPAHETAKILYGLYTLKLVRKKTEGIHVISSLPAADFT
jgi:hypothetical protein